MTKHTPGPWWWEDYQGMRLLLVSERRTVILDDACCNPQDEPIIAAAPKLLKALVDLECAADAFRADQDRATDKRCGLVQPVTVADCEALNAACTNASAVIAEAEGKP